MFLCFSYNRHLNCVFVSRRTNFVHRHNTVYSNNASGIRTWAGQEEMPPPPSPLKKGSDNVSLTGVPFVPCSILCRKAPSKELLPYDHLNYTSKTRPQPSGNCESDNWKRKAILKIRVSLVPLVSLQCRSEHKFDTRQPRRISTLKENYYVDNYEGVIVKRKAILIFKVSLVSLVSFQYHREHKFDARLREYDICEVGSLPL